MNIKLWWKQVFCSHIWKDEQSEILRERVWQIDGMVIARYTYISQHQKCVICQEERIIELKQEAK